MKTDQEYTKDLTDIRSMMERSSKFLSLTGWSGIMAGIYALAGAYIAYRFFHMDEAAGIYKSVDASDIFLNQLLLAGVILVLTLSTAILLSQRKSQKIGVKLWNPVARRLLINMSIPLFTGGVFILILLSKGLIGLALPLTLIFYGLALLTVGKYTYEELKYLGLMEIGLGLFATCFLEYALLFWALGFGLLHIVYGIYLHLRYEK